MANFDQSFEEFRCDVIAHLSARLGLAPDVVAAELSAWLRGFAGADRHEGPPATPHSRVRS